MKTIEEMLYEVGNLLDATRKRLEEEMKDRQDEKITRVYYLHKTLKNGKEIYICNNTPFQDVYDNYIYIGNEKVLTSTNKANVRYFTSKEARAIRNLLNKGRETKLYWWGISKK